MIKAAFFDLFNTLIHYEPLREDLYYQAFQNHGIKVPVQAIFKGIQVADRVILSQNGKMPQKESIIEEKANRFLIYPKAISEEAGITVPPHIQKQIIQEVLREFKSDFALFDDALPLFQQLRKRHLIIGIITNADKHVITLIESMGFKPFIDVIVTSEQVGVGKPDTLIFHTALKQAQVPAAESVYIGDQYSSDIIGARNSGMKPILIDRHNIETDIHDCIKINTLNEALKYIQAPSGL